MEIALARVIIKKLSGSSKKGAVRPETVGQKRVRGSDGELLTLRTLNAGSKTFGRDFTYVFGKNVAKARRENKRVTGSTDVAPIKG